MIKDTMKRKKPSFNEEYHGYRTFTALLEDAAQQGFIELEKHKTSGTYVVTRFGEEMKQERIILPQPVVQSNGPRPTRPTTPVAPAARELIRRRRKEIRHPTLARISTLDHPSSPREPRIPNSTNSKIDYWIAWNPATATDFSSSLTLSMKGS